MKVYSQLEKAQLENVTSDVANEPKGMVKYRTDIDQAKVSNGTTYKTLIDEDSTQSLSNKTLISPEVNGAITFDQIATPATPAAGENKFYFKNDNKAYYLDSAGTERAVGSGSGGEINFLQLSDVSWDAEAGTIGWNLYQDAAASRPVDGTGGTPAVTVSTLAFNALSGDRSIILTKPNSNVQGQGWSIDFNIDRANQARVLKVEFDYNVAAGTFVAGTTSADSDIIVYLYDVTNNRLIEPSTFRLFSNSTTVADKFSGYFQTSADSLDYRLIFHVTTTSAVAFDLRVDNIIVTPSKYVFGTPITDWVAYTPTITTVTGTMTNFTPTGFWRRVGGDIQVKAAISFTGASGTWSAPTISLPPGVNIDFTKGAYNDSGNALYRNGSVVFNDASVNSFDGNAVAGSALGTNVFRVVNRSVNTLDAGATLDAVYYPGTGAITNSYPVAFNTGDVIAVNDVSFPIQGWSSSVKVSDGFDARDVSARYTAALSGTLATVETLIPYTTRIFDTTSSMNAGTFTAPSSGTYRFSASLEANFSGNNTLILRARKNGVTFQTHAIPSTVAIGAIIPQVHGTIDLRAGDTLSFAYLATSSAGTLQNNPTTAICSIERLQSPQTIAQGEVVAARYSSTSGQSLPDATVTLLNFSTKTFDTHNAVTTGASWRFTSQSYGFYAVTSTIQIQASAPVAYSAFAAIFKNNVAYTIGDRYNSTTQLSTVFSCHVQGVVEMNAGDFIDIRAFQDNTANTTLNLLTAGDANSVSITKVG